MRALRSLAFSADFMAFLLVLFLLAAAVRVEGHSVELDLVEKGNTEGLVRPRSPHVLVFPPSGGMELDGVSIEIEAITDLSRDGRPFQIYAELPPQLSQVLGTLYDQAIPVYLSVHVAE